MKKPTFSQSRVRTFLNCRQKDYWIYHEGLSPKEKSRPLLVGDLTHKLLHLHDIDELTPDLIAVVPDVMVEMNPHSDPDFVKDTCTEAARLVGGYISYHEYSDYKVVSPELVLTMDVGDFHLYARLDGLAESTTPGLWRLERKTTAQKRASYLKTHQTGLQTGISHWLMTELMKDVKVRGSIFDWIVKTKMPQYEQSETPLDRSLLRRCQKTVYGVYQSLKAGNIYPNVDRCEDYNGCEFKILCRNDSAQNREAFFEDRKEAMNRSQDDNFMKLLKKHSKLQKEN